MYTLTTIRRPENDLGGSLDLIWGAAAIGKELGLTPRQCVHQLESGRLPARKHSGKWVASRTGLRLHFADIIEGRIAA
jgi:hypothetical protein